jgi:putative ABC transport system permease protein
MPMFVLAWRNVFRNRRRTLLTIGMVSLSLAAVIALWGVFEGNNRQVIESAVSHLTGHLRLAAAASPGTGPVTVLPDLARTTALLQSNPDVLAFTPRVDGQALLSVGVETLGIALVGIDPDTEPKITKFKNEIVAGRYLVRGDKQSILLTSSVAQRLHAGIGDEVVLIVEAADGSIGAGKFTLTGTLASHDDELQTSVGLVPITAAQDLYGLDDRITSLAVTIREPDRLSEVATRLQNAAGPDYRVQTWKELFPALAQAVTFHQVFTLIILAIVLVLLSSGVANTMLMAALERRREWGVLLALGSTPQRLFGLILAEGLVLGVIAIPLGVALGMIPIAYFSRAGLNLALFRQGLEAMAGHAVVVYPVLAPGSIAFVSLLSLAVVIGATLHPAAKTAAMAPVAAIRNLPSRNLPGAPSKPAAGRQWMIWNTALRNAGRNRRRSLLVAGASAVGIASMILINGMIDGFVHQITENSTSFLTGHLQIGRRGFYRSERTAKQLIEWNSDLERTIGATGKPVKFARRIETTAMISSAEGSAAIRLLGIDVEHESTVTRLLSNIQQGSALVAGDDGGILLGAELARHLHASVGGKVVMTLQNAEGDLSGAAYRVRGLIATESKAFDSSLAVITLRAAQQQLGANDRFTVVAIRLEDSDLADQVEQITGLLNRNLTGIGLEAVSWRTLLPQSEEILEVSHAAFAVILAIALGVTALGSMNSVLMSVGERRREIGMLLALGTTPGRILRMVLYESSCVVFMGLIVGTACGTLLTLFLGWYGIELGAFAEVVAHLPGMTSVLHPQLVVSHFTTVALCLLALNAIACIYPSWLAARLDPVTNLRVN